MHRRNQEGPLMRIYIIGNDGITLCREPPANIEKDEIAVASKEELQAGRLSGKRLLGHCQLKRPWYARRVGGAVARVGELLCSPIMLPRSSGVGPEKAISVR